MVSDGPESRARRSGATLDNLSGWLLDSGESGKAPNGTNKINHASDSRDPSAQTSKSIVGPGDCPQLRLARQHGGDYLKRAEAAGLGWPLPEGQDEKELLGQGGGGRAHRRAAILAALRDARFFNVGELNQAMAPLLAKLNEQPFQKLEGSRNSWFETLERSQLLPLPALPFDLGT